MNVLLACEESQTVCIEFRKRGHNAFSCDLLPCSGGYPQWHIQQDVLELLRTTENYWDLMIAFPPCTYLTITGNKWFKPEYRERFPNRYEQRESAKKFFLELANADIPKICIENPVGIMNTEWRKPDQIIQPYNFGHKEPKKTCLWLKGLPSLLYEKDLFFEGYDQKTPEYHTTKSGKRMPKWYAYADKSKGQAHRAKIRSTFFPGVARAMAEQWG